MKMPVHNTQDYDSETPEGRSSRSSRVLVVILIAIPCLLLIFGLLLGTVLQPDTSSVIYGLGGYVPSVVVVVLLFISASLFKNNPRLSRASLWRFRSYAESVAGLDEREKMVVDQAFRTAYRIILMGFILVLVCAVINAQTFHLSYHAGQLSFFYIACGVFGLLLYLPMTIVAWKENV